MKTTASRADRIATIKCLLDRCAVSEESYRAHAQALGCALQGASTDVRDRGWAAANRIGWSFKGSDGKLVALLAREMYVAQQSAMSRTLWGG